MSTQNTAPTAQATLPAARIQQRRTYLMCRPEHFTVSYTINPWMEPANPTDTAKALAQWQVLHDTYVALGHEVHLIDPIEGLPDMVYTEYLTGALYLDSRTEVATHLEVLDHMSTAAASAERTKKILREFRESC